MHHHYPTEMLKAMQIYRILSTFIQLHFSTVTNVYLVHFRIWKSKVYCCCDLELACLMFLPAKERMDYSLFAAGG